MTETTPNRPADDRRPRDADHPARPEGRGDDIAYRVLDTPVGQLLVACTRRGLLRVSFETQGFETVLGELADRVSPRLMHAPGKLDRAARQLEEYFHGARDSFDLPLDHRLSRGFGRSVHHLLPRIPYGDTWTYREVAEALGNPKAVRAVGTACGRNPLPLVVPCHRVLRSDGSLGGYAGGLAAKRQLLTLEQETAGQRRPTL